MNQDYCFLTAHEHYAPYACGRGIFRYALKETLDIEFSRVLSDLFEALEQVNNNRYYIKKYIGQGPPELTPVEIIDYEVCKAESSLALDSG